MVDFTTEEGLRMYLASRNDNVASVQLLTGGTANYVYRVTYKDSSTAIFKHAAPYLHSNKNLAFDQMRMDYEASILSAISSLEDRSSPLFTHTVGLIKYDKKEKLLRIEDGGERNLKEAYTDPNLDVHAIGVDLAKWLAILHLRSTNKSLAIDAQSDIATAGNNPVAVAIYRHSYKNLYTALSKYGHDVMLAERINDEFGSLLATDDECVCHGDFWPGNVLVRPQSSNHKVSHKTPVELTIVDWEMVRRGISATDVGQFAAESFLLDCFRGDRGLRYSFLNTYVTVREGATTTASGNSRQIGREWIKRMAVHWAVHVAFWPTRVEWADDEGTRKLVEIGVEVLNAALTNDWARLKESPLFKDLRKEWHEAFACS